MIGEIGMRVNHRHLVLFLFIILVGVIGGCSGEQKKTSINNQEANEHNNNIVNEEENNENDEVKADPEEKTTIVIAYQWSEDSFNERFKPIEEYLGNVEIEYADSNGTLARFEELFSANVQPDLFMDQNIFALQDLDLIYPLDDLIEQSGFDIETINQPLLDWIRAYDNENRIIGLPDGTSNVALYYNEEVFDLLGEDYPDPEEPMTWTEVMDLNRRMTTVQDGIQYIGLELHSTPYPLRQFEPNATDPDTGELLINEDEAFKRYFDLYADYYNVPGIDEETLANAFLEKRAGMVIAPQLQGLRDYAAGDPEFIDMAPLPVWEDQPTIGPYTGTTPMMIANYSENKEIAFKILEAYFEPELLIQPVKVGATAPPVSDPEVYKQFAREHELYEGKNLDAFHVLETASPDARVSRWDEFVDIGSAEKAIREGVDVVTALRELEEDSAAKIAEAMAAE